MSKDSMLTFPLLFPSMLHEMASKNIKVQVNYFVLEVVAPLYLSHSPADNFHLQVYF